jgi:hypothetical protein
MTTTNPKSFLQQSFEQAFAKIAVHVSFKEEWAQGDYMNGAVHEMLGFGQVVKTTFPGANKRRAILVGTRAGTVAVFERYTPDMGQPFVLVSNMPQQLRFILPSGQINEDLFLRAFINPYRPEEDNIHTRVEEIFNSDINNIRVG